MWLLHALLSISVIRFKRKILHLFICITFLRQLKQLQADDANENKSREEKKKSAELQKCTDKEFILSCRKCDKFVCKSIDIR